MFHGEPTVGLQPGIPLSRRVQLAVLAHIRHTHTRYDQLLKDTTWMNARKAVEPVCLDVLVKWRGDEETGRDQMDEILREVVIITDTEESEESSDDDSSGEEGEITSSSSASLSQPNSRTQNRCAPMSIPVAEPGALGQLNQNSDIETTAPVAVSSQNHSKRNVKAQRDKRAQRGFKRYQAAWEQAVSRREAQGTTPADTPYEDLISRKRQQGVVSPIQEPNQYIVKPTTNPQGTAYGAPEQRRYHDSIHARRPVSQKCSFPSHSMPWRVYWQH